MHRSEISFTERDLWEIMRLLAEEPSTHARLMDVARQGVMSYCGEQVDRELMEKVTQPNLLNVVIHAHMDMPKLLTAIGRKFIEDYNYTLKNIQHAQPA